MEDSSIVELYWQRDEQAITQTAAKYGLTENHVMVILSRTRKKLKALLVKEGLYLE